jgi:DNA-binding PadR family transcriptional regulator
MHRFHKRHHSRHRSRHHHQFGPWAWQGRFFESGELPLALLSLLEEGPQHGYQLMKRLEERSGGIYRASAGSIYPTLQQLQDEGLVSSESADGGKRVYQLTEAGRSELGERETAVRVIWGRAQQDEWDDWSHAMHPDAAEILRPAFRVMRSAFRAADRAAARDPERVEEVRAILDRTRCELNDLAET